MRALIFIPTLTAGGAERVASILANQWCNYADVSVTILLMFEDEVFFDVDPRVKICSLGMKPRLSAMSRLLFLIKSLKSFRRYVRDEKPDFVLSFMNKYNVFCLASLLGAGVPTIVSERGSPYEAGRKFNWFLRRLFYPRASGIITQTTEGAEYLFRVIKNKNIIAIFNPIQSLENNEVCLRQKFVLYIGRLLKQKGLLDLVQAFAKTGADDWRLVLCGDGPLKGEIERVASEFGIADRLDLKGQVKDTNFWLNRAGIFAFPSYHEGFPNSLAEALVAGVPTVSYNCSTGPSELITHGENGYLVEVGDVEGLSAHIRNLMDDFSCRERFSRNAKRIVDKLDATTVSRIFFDFCAVSAAREKKRCAKLDR